MSAVNAFALIDLAETVLIVVDGVYRTRLLAGALQMYDGTERTCLRAFSAFTTFFRIDLHAEFSLCDGTELARSVAFLAKAEPAIIRNGIC